MTPEQQEEYRKTTTDEGNKRWVVLSFRFHESQADRMIAWTSALQPESIHGEMIRAW